MGHHTQFNQAQRQSCRPFLGDCDHAGQSGVIKDFIIVPTITNEAELSFTVMACFGSTGSMQNNVIKATCWSFSKSGFGPAFTAFNFRISMKGCQNELHGTCHAKQKLKIHCIPKWIDTADSNHGLRTSLAVRPNNFFSGVSMLDCFASTNIDHSASQSPNGKIELN